MAAPTINPITSLLTLTQGRYYELQLIEAVGSSAATGWEVYRGFLPPGISLDEETGMISGTPNARASEGSVWQTQVRATNNDGASPALALTWGIERAEVGEDGGLHAVIDLDTGSVGFPGTDQVTSENRPVVHLRAGNKIPFTVVFVRRGEVVDLPLTSLEYGGRRIADEPLTVSFRADDDTSVVRVGDGQSARFVGWIDLTGQALTTDLVGESGKKGVAVSYVSSIRFKWGVDIGDQEEAVRSSLEFWTVIHAESL